MLLPRFAQEGKKYAAITIGCTGGRHRSVYLVEKLAQHLVDRIAAAQAIEGNGLSWRLHVAHRELAREGVETASLPERPVPQPRIASEDIGVAAAAAPGQAQEA